VEPTALPTEPPPTVAPPAEPTSTSPPTEPPAPEPATPAPAPLHVANTGGIGVFLRATPRAADRIRPWQDGTEMVPVGEETENEGRRWVKVRDPEGTVGWVPAEFLAG
jgi:hypothetical protein